MKPESYNNFENEWSILTSFSDLKILSKYVGELRFGPTYLQIKSEPFNVFGLDYFGDWFYRTNNGIYLQKWNSNPVRLGVHTKVNCDLVFFDTIEYKLETMLSNIKSFHWTIVKNENGKLSLISDNGRTKRQIEIP